MPRSSETPPGNHWARCSRSRQFDERKVASTRDAGDCGGADAQETAERHRRLRVRTRRDLQLWLTRHFEGSGYLAEVVALSASAQESARALAKDFPDTTLPIGKTIPLCDFTGRSANREKAGANELGDARGYHGKSKLRFTADPDKTARQAVQLHRRGDRGRHGFEALLKFAMKWTAAWVSAVPGCESLRGCLFVLTEQPFDRTAKSRPIPKRRRRSPSTAAQVRSQVWFSWDAFMWNKIRPQNPGSMPRDGCTVKSHPGRAMQDLRNVIAVLTVACPMRDARFTGFQFTWPAHNQSLTFVFDLEKTQGRMKARRTERIWTV